MLKSQNNKGSCTYRKKKKCTFGNKKMIKAHTDKILILLWTYTIIFFILSTIACSKTDNNGYLSKLDSLADNNPEKVLNEINHSGRCNINVTKDKMRIALVKYKAEDKNYIVHSSDSAITILYDYFQRHGNISEQLECLYYLGSTYRDMYDYPLSIVWYSKAIEFAETKACS